MLMGIVGNPPRRDNNISEMDAWRFVFDAMEQVEAEGRLNWRQSRFVSDVKELAAQMGAQLKRGVHVNGRRPLGTKTSNHVMAIVYVHRDDGKFYCHGFGDADIKLRSKGDALTIEGLKERTNVQMYAEPDGSVRIKHKDGEPIWENIR